MVPMREFTFFVEAFHEPPFGAPSIARQVGCNAAHAERCWWTTAMPVYSWMSGLSVRATVLPSLSLNDDWCLIFDATVRAAFSG
jgi:hypothetical protein